MFSVHSTGRARFGLAAICLSVALLAGCSMGGMPTAPTRIALSAKPNSIAVRASDGALFITDDTSNSVLLAPDASTFAHYASIPTVQGQPNSLSQLTFADSNTLLIERFGFGSAGALFNIPGADTVIELTGSDPARRRLGLAASGPNQVLSTWFIKNGNQPPQGGLSLLTYDVSAHSVVERDLLSGLGKPVGVVVSGDTVFVSDQANNTIVKASLSAMLAATHPTTTSTVVAHIDSPDLLAIDRSGALYTKCNATGLCQIAPDGSVKVLANDFQDARGVAVDRLRLRLYVIDRTTTAGGTSYLRTFPLN